MLNSIIYIYGLVEGIPTVINPTGWVVIFGGGLVLTGFLERT